MFEQVLSGIKVLDLTHYIAGPFCTKLMADYGADVIKIERPGGGDAARRVGPFPGDVPHLEKSGLFLYLNTNKQGITLNLKTKMGVDIFKELVKKADVLVENFHPDVMPKLGLDFETLKKVNPRLIMTSISSYGQAGPYRDWKASEIVLYALSGQMSKQGDPDREPLKHALYIFQYFAGKIACFVTVAAAIRQAISGEGEYIDISILDAMRGDIQNKIIDYAYSGYIGNRHVAKNSPIYPHGGFPAKDGYVAMQGRGGGARWAPRLFDMMDQPELKNDPRFSTANNVAKNSEEFYSVLYSWLVDHTKKEIFEAARRARYPVGPVNTTEDLLNDPQYKERGFFVDIDHPVAGKFKYPGAPFKMEGGFAVRMPAPLLGQHNKETYCGLLGYSEEDLSTLSRCGVI
ncbi:MAG: CoA transferase [Chloroflexi bacterium]|nr:CoA transferase [Chloroflexota bacterium]